MSKKLRALAIGILTVPIAFSIAKIDVQAYDVSTKYTNKSYYHDTQYEYTVGIRPLYDVVKEASGSTNNLLASKPKVQDDAEGDSWGTVDYFRDITTNKSIYGKVPHMPINHSTHYATGTANNYDSKGYDGWQCWDAQWLTTWNYNHFWLRPNSGSECYSQYNGNGLDYVIKAQFPIQGGHLVGEDENGIEQKGSYGSNTGWTGEGHGIGDGLQHYRRTAMFIFRRPMANPMLGNTYISKGDEDKFYANGSNLWKKSGNVTVRTWAYDLYSYGDKILSQNAQYNGAIRYNYLGLKQKDSDGQNEKYTKIKTDRTGPTSISQSFVDNANSVENVNSVGVYDWGPTAVTNPNSKGHNQRTYQDTGIQLTLGTQNNKDYQIYSSAKNKLERNLDNGSNGLGFTGGEMSGDGATWYQGFKYGGKNYNWLKIDDDYPSIDGLPTETQKNMLSCTFTVKTKDTRSGFKSLKIYDNDTEITDKALKKSSEEDTSEHEQTVTINTVGTHKIKVESTDNLDNKNTKEFTVEINPRPADVWCHIDQYKYAEPKSHAKWVNCKESFMINCQLGMWKDCTDYYPHKVRLYLDRHNGNEVHTKNYVNTVDVNSRDYGLYDDEKPNAQLWLYKVKKIQAYTGIATDHGFGATLGSCTYITATYDLNGQILKPYTSGYNQIGNDYYWCWDNDTNRIRTRGECNGDYIAVDGDTPQLVSLNANNGVFEIQDRNSGIYQVTIRENDANGRVLYHKVLDQKANKVRKIQGVISETKAKKVWIYLNDNVDNSATIVKDFDYKPQILGKIVFNPDKTDWTNKGKIVEGKGKYPVNVRYTGTNPYMVYGTTILHHEENNNVYDEYRVIPVKYSIKQIDVTKDEVTTVNGAQGDISIKKEGDKLQLAGVGRWQQSYELPHVGNHEKLINQDLKSAPAEPTGSAGLYKLDWTKSPIDITNPNKKWVNQPYNIHYKIIDALSGIKEADIKISDTSHYKNNQEEKLDKSIEGLNAKYERDISLKDGIYSTDVSVKDIAGNTNSASRKTYYVDTTEPEVTFGVSQIFDEKHGAKRVQKSKGEFSYYGEIILSDNLSGCKEASYSWTYGKEDKGKYQDLYKGDYTYNDRYKEKISKLVEKPVGDNLYLHVRLTDVAGNQINKVFGPFEDGIKIRNFEVTDFRDPNYTNVFWKKPYTEYTGTKYAANKLPIDKDSHPTMKNVSPKKGYAFYFDLTSEFLYRKQDRIEIKPTFYYMDGSKVQECDMYYEYNNNPLTKVGSGADKTKITLDTSANGKVLIGGLNKLTLTRGVRICKGREWDKWKDEMQYKDGKVQWWYGKYFIPNTAKFVKHGVKPTKVNEIKFNKIIVKFDIIAYKNGIETLSSDQIYSYLDEGIWKKEGGPKSSKYADGDVIVYDNKYSNLSNFISNVIQ